MNTYTIAVDVALSRPPRADATRYVIVSAPDDVSAQITAAHMMRPDVVMPVRIRILSVIL